jgi:hypothetical protein
VPDESLAGAAGRIAQGALPHLGDRP